MNTKLLMSISAIVTGLTGLVLTFLPSEILILTGGEQTNQTLLMLQLIGASYFAFAMLNWMARGNIIGGIYSRPITIGNFTHFFMAGIGLLKSASHFASVFPWAVGVIYMSLALLFGLILYTHPGKNPASGN